MLPPTQLYLVHFDVKFPLLRLLLFLIDLKSTIILIFNIFHMKTLGDLLCISNYFFFIKDIEKQLEYSFFLLLFFLIPIERS